MIALFIAFCTPQLMAETEAETIAKCVTDLTSSDVKVRRRAVLILCKYQSSEVFRKLIPILSDKDAKVRESVVVGFIESRIMLRDAALPILKRLLDTNVHTRRMVSSTLLPRIIFYLSMNRAESTAILKKSLHDKDSIVRKNLMSNFYSLRRYIETENFHHFLGDESSEIKLLALTKLPSSLPYEVFEPYLEKLVQDKDKKIRTQVLKSLGGFGAAGRKYLAIMAKDEVPAIAARAMAYSRNVNYLSALYKMILDEGSSSDLVIDLTMTIINWNEESKKFVYKLLEHSDEIRRYAALKSLARMRLKVTLKKLLILVKEDSARTRKLACSLIQGKQNSAETVSELALSDYADVRGFALVLAVRDSRQNPEMIEALYDLMLDEELTIRTKALQGIWLCGAKDRYEIFSQSLSDSEPAIRDMAARTLLDSNEAQARKLIEDFKKNNKDINIKHLQNINLITSLKATAKAQQEGWQKEVKKALYNDSMNLKEAAVDITLSTRDPLLINILRNYLDTAEDSDLADYLYKRIAEEEQ